MDEHLFVDRADGMAAHVYFVPGNNPWAVRIIDMESDRPFPSLHAFKRRDIKLLRDKKTVEQYGEATY